MAMRVLCCSIVVLVEATGENRGGGSGRRAKIARLEMSSRDGPASARELKMGTSTYVSAGGRSLYTLFIGCEFNAFNTWVTHKWVRLMGPLRFPVRSALRRMGEQVDNYDDVRPGFLA